MGLHNHNQSEMRQGFEIAKNAALEFFEEIARKAETVIILLCSLKICIMWL